METGVNNLKDFLEILVWLVGAGSLIYAAHSYKTSQKQLNFAVIVSCTERFQKIMPQLKSENAGERQCAIKAYIDLCNEELFYFKHKYLPEEIVEEWIDGMVYYLPQFEGKFDAEELEQETKNNQELPEQIAEQKLLAEYPRIKEAFTVGRYYDVSKKSERMELINRIKLNLESLEQISN